MRATRVLCRNSKGHSWFGHYKEFGQEGFKKNVAPTPFNWAAKPETPRPSAVFTIRIDKEIIGDLKFQLTNDVTPKTVENFVRLVQGNGAVFKGYSGTPIHMIRKGEFIMAGDIEGLEGKGNHSSYQSRYIKDENFIIPHSERGLLSMTSMGRDTSGSQFYIDLAPNPHMNGRCMVIGQMVDGQATLAAIEQVFTVRGTPARQVVIESCKIV